MSVRAAIGRTIARGRTWPHGLAAGDVPGRLAAVVGRRSRRAALAIGVLVSSAAIVAPATPVVAAGDLSVLLQSEAGRSVETESGGMSYLRLSNQGGAIVPNVTLRIDLPDVVHVDGWDPEDGCSLAGETVVCPLGDIPGYGIRTVGVGFYVPSDAPEGDYAVLWSVTTGSVSEPSVYADEFTIVEGTPPPPPVPDVSVHQTLSHPSMTVGAEEYFLLELYNAGDVTVPGVEMFTGVPNDFELVGVSDPSCTISGRIVKCIYSSLDPGDSRTVQIDVIPQDGAVGELITSTVYVGPVGASSSGVFWDIDESFVSVYPPNLDADADADGILDVVDADEGTGASPGAFGDANVNGTIVSVPAGWSVLVSDAPAPDGVRIVVDGDGTERVTVSVCGFTLKLSAGSDVVLTCGSVVIDVTAGTVEVELGGGVVVVTVQADSSAVVDTVSGGGYSVDVTAGSVTVWVDGVVRTIDADDGTATIRAWDFVGFDQPVDGGSTINSVKAGRAVPLKWRLLDEFGAPVLDLMSVKVTFLRSACDGSGVDAVEQTLNVGSGLQNMGDGRYQLNWKTPSTKGCGTLQLDVGDGVLHTAKFLLT